MAGEIIVDIGGASDHPKGDLSYSERLAKINPDSSVIVFDPLERSSNLPNLVYMWREGGYRPSEKLPFNDHSIHQFHMNFIMGQMKNPLRTAEFNAQKVTLLPKYYEENAINLAIADEIATQHMKMVLPEEMWSKSTMRDYEVDIFEWTMLLREISRCLVPGGLVHISESAENTNLVHQIVDKMVPELYFSMRIRSLHDGEETSHTNWFASMAAPHNRLGPVVVELKSNH